MEDCKVQLNASEYDWTKAQIKGNIAHVNSTFLQLFATRDDNAGLDVTDIYRVILIYKPQEKVNHFIRLRFTKNKNGIDFLI